VRAKHKKRVARRAIAPRCDQPSPLRLSRWVANHRHLVLGLLACLAFSIFYVHIRLNVDPRSIYHADGIALPGGRSVDGIALPGDQSVSVPLFVTGPTFLHQFVNRPGGPVEYVAALLCQFYYYSEGGPLVLTAIAMAICLLGWDLARRLAAPAGLLFLCLPLLLLLVACNQYTFRLEHPLAVVAILVNADLYVAIAPRTTPGVRLLLFLPQCVVLYCLVGGPALLFPVLCALFEVFWQRQYLLGAMELIAGAAVGTIGIFVYQLPASAAYGRLWEIPFWPGRAGTAVRAALYLVFPVSWLIWAGAPAVRRAASGRFPWLTAWTSSSSGRLWKTVGALVVVLSATLVAALWTLNRDAQARLHANSLARQGRWQDLLTELRRCPPQEYGPSLLCDVNRALFETGHMGDQLFCYPQRPFGPDNNYAGGKGALFTIGMLGPYLEGSSDILLQLGCVNEAEHVAEEKLELLGRRPRILRQLALIRMVKGEPESARVYLRALCGDLIQGAWAEEYLRRLEEDPELLDDTEIIRLRSIMLRRDLIGGVVSVEQLLQALLEQNPTNRMAIEYLMAHRLLNHFFTGQSGRTR
jgi:hypothetical protein